MGTTKNIVDSCCVGITLLIGFLTNRLFYGIGIGTILAMIFVGRVIHLFNQMCKKPIAALTAHSFSYAFNSFNNVFFNNRYATIAVKISDAACA